MSRKPPPAYFADPKLARLTVVRLADIDLDPDNERSHPPENLAALRGSLRAFGLRSPVGVRMVNGRMVASKGNGTIQVMRQLAADAASDDPIDIDDGSGELVPLWHTATLRPPDVDGVGERVDWQDVPVLIFDDDEATAAAYRVTDNRTAELAGWDWSPLSVTLGSLADQIEWTDLGWTEAEMEPILSLAAGDDGDGTEAPDLPAPPVRENRRVLIIRLEGERADSMRSLAEAAGMKPTDLLLSWLADRCPVDG